MSLLENIPQWQFSRQDRETMGSALSILKHTDKKQVKKEFISFINRNISFINFQEPLLDLMYSPQPVICVDGWNTALFTNWDRLQDYRFIYADSPLAIPQIIQNTFYNFGGGVRKISGTQTDNLQLRDYVTFLKNVIVLLSKAGSDGNMYLIIFKIRKQAFAQEGLVKTRIPYIYLLFIETNDQGSEIDDMACVYFAYLFEKYYGKQTSILTSDEYNWSADLQNKASTTGNIRETCTEQLCTKDWINKHKTLFVLKDSQDLIYDVITLLYAAPGYRTKLYQLAH